MAVWSLVIGKIATLEDLENNWSLDDMMRAHAFLEMRSDIMEEQRKAANVNRKISPN
jgi:hypothetical protein